MSKTKSRDTRPTLIGYLPPVEGIRKTGANYRYHSQFINVGDICYAHAGAKLTSGRNFEVWNFSMSAAEVNERFSKVIFFIPCRIAPSPHEQDGYPYSLVTSFVEGLRIPFFSLGESVQTSSYEYESSFHKMLSPEVVRYLEVISDRSPIVGARGEYSADVLNKLGIKNVMPLGCPSLYVNWPNLPSSLLIWGAGALTSRLLCDTSLAKANICCVIDRNKALQGQRLLNTVIADPASIECHRWATVFIAITTYALAIRDTLLHQYAWTGRILMLELGGAS